MYEAILVLNIIIMYNKKYMMFSPCQTITRVLAHKSRRGTKLKFYNVMTSPVLLYNSEN
jgi:hypothetical protein